MTSGLPPSTDPVPPDVIADRFEVLARAGTGGFASVWRARDRVTGADVAVKLLHRQRADHVARFEREADLLAALDHPALVRLHARGHTPQGEPYLVMEWLQGGTLEARVQRAPLSLASVLRVGARVADALGAAHAHGIVHRDVKPNNVFLVGDDEHAPTPGRELEIKLFDFGVARTETSERLTATGMVAGTPAYMAPEQARGLEVDARADVFALGCVLYFCIAGAPAFPGKSALEVLLRIVMDDTPRVRDVAPDIPPYVDELVATLMAKTADVRPRDGVAAAELIREALAKLPASASSKVHVPVRTKPMPPLEGDSTAQSIASQPLLVTATEQRVGCFLILSRRQTAPGNQDPPLSRRAADHEILRVEDPTVHTARSEEVGNDDAIVRETKRHGGRVQPLADGSLLIVFQAPGPTDQASRAARCGIAIRTLEPYRRIALVVGRDAKAIAAERGAALLAAPPGQGVRVDEVGAALLASRFSIGSDGSGVLVLAERSAADVAPVLLGRASPFVGRERELAVLTATLDESVGESVVRAVVVAGSAGSGKSRLVQEFLRRAHEAQRGSKPVTVWIGRGDALAADTPLGLLGGAFRSAMGIHAGMPRAEQRQRVEAFAKERSPVAIRTAAFLGEAIGVPFEESYNPALAAARRDAVLCGDLVRAAVDDALRGQCKMGPLVLVLEDLHEADQGSIKLVDDALRALHAASCVVLGVGRPELRSRFPGLFEAHGVVELRLPPLSKRSARELVRAVLEGYSEPEIDQVIDRAAGNVFCLEELIRSAARGRLRAVPESVLAMIEARIAELPPESRRALRAASVYGLRCRLDGLGALIPELREPTSAGTPRRLPPSVATLVAEELLDLVRVDQDPGAPTDASRPRPPDELVFRHALVREAAYAMLMVEDRRRAHGAAAAWLEATGDAEPRTLAEHYERAGSIGAAARFYQRSAQRSLAAQDVASAIQDAERVLACMAAGAQLDGTDPLAGEIHLILAEAHGWRGENDAAIKHAVDAMRLLPRGSTRWCIAAGYAARASARLGDLRMLLNVSDALSSDEIASRYAGTAFAPYVTTAARVAESLLLDGQIERADRLFDRIESVGVPRESAAPVAVGWVHGARAIRAKLAHDLDRFVQGSRDAVRCLERGGDLRSACSQREALACALLETGQLDAAKSELEIVLRTSGEMGLLTVRASAQLNLGLAARRLGDDAKAVALIEEAAVAFLQMRDQRMIAVSRAHLAEALLSTSANRARFEAETAVQLAAFSPPLLAQCLGVLGRVLLRAGLVAESLQATRRGAAILGELGGIDEGEATLRLAHAEALEAAGSLEDARAAVREAARSIRQKAESMSGAPRASFLERIPEHLATFEAERRLGE